MIHSLLILFCPQTLYYFTVRSLLLKVLLISRKRGNAKYQNDQYISKNTLYFDIQKRDFLTF